MQYGFVFQMQSIFCAGCTSEIEKKLDNSKIETLVRVWKKYLGGLVAVLRLRVS